MDQRQIQLVQSSFARAARIGPHVAATFYGELFAIDPSLRTLFKTDMIVQGRKLMEMLNYVVTGLGDADAMLPQVRELALRHVAYGVEAHHYAMAGTALLRTLRHELGSEFTMEARAAWAAAYQLISDAMREAAYGAAASRSP